MFVLVCLLGCLFVCLFVGLFVCLFVSDATPTISFQIAHG